MTLSLGTDPVMQIRTDDLFGADEDELSAVEKRISAAISSIDRFLR